MTEVIKEAVEALAFAMCHDKNEHGGDSIHEDFLWVASGVIKHLNAKGFIIARQPAMTEAELEREAENMAVISRTHGVTLLMIRNMFIELAKKYRGM